MKKLLIALVVMASAVTITVSDAEAKRLGGGGSFGRQSQGVTRSAPAQSSQAERPNSAAAAPAPQQPQGVPARPASPWRGMLGGALLGLGLGALLSHFGLGGAMASMISTILMVALLALAVMFIMRMFRRRNDETGKPAYASYSSGAGNYSRSNTPEIGSRVEPRMQPAALETSSAMAGAASAAPWGVPADFDTPAFLRNAKTYFLRLQEAWDRGDINDIREFATPEMFAELKMQLQERGSSANKTDVVSLDAELLGIETVNDDYLASVKFTGMIKEEENAPAAPFAEVWNLAKPVSGQGGWVLAGIQQLS